MKKELGIAVSLVSLCAAPALAEGEKRELGAHEHGHSALNIAIEGDRVEMELIAPGADIVGFEHEAKSAEDVAAVEQAEATLGEPLTLFGFADAAGCVVETAAIEIEGEEHHGDHGDEDHADDDHDHEHDEDHAEAKHDDHEHEHEEEHHAEHEHEGEASHNEFHAEYALACSTPDALDGIDFAAFFEAFSGAEEVEVTVISEKGQSSYEVERDAPKVDFQGVI
ncbi:MAG: DUF2796 domain-containing protein [Pseudomonadota bacterium]